MAPWTRQGNEFAGATVAHVPTVPGRVVIFEGEYVFHRVTPMGATAAGQALAQVARDAKDGMAAAAGKAAGEAAGAVGKLFPRRVVLSMTFTTDAHIDVLSEATRRLKDMSYFGPFALLN